MLLQCRASSLPCPPPNQPPTCGVLAPPPMKFMAGRLAAPNLTSCGAAGSEAGGGGWVDAVVLVLGRCVAAAWPVPGCWLTLASVRGRSLPATRPRAQPGRGKQGEHPTLQELYRSPMKDSLVQMATCKARSEAAAHDTSREAVHDTSRCPITGRRRAPAPQWPGPARRPPAARRRGCCGCSAAQSRPPHPPP